MDQTLTEQKIQRVLGKFMASPKYSVDGLFVFPWESDKLLRTKAGYIYEFEIKISRSDYQNDFKHKADEYLRRQLGSDKAGTVRTGLRSLRNVDRAKKKKPYDWEV